jgi:hypothetical protein
MAPPFSGHKTRQAIEERGEDRLIWGARRQVDLDLGFQLDDAGGEIDQAQSQGVELHAAALTASRNSKHESLSATAETPLSRGLNNSTGSAVPRCHHGQIDISASSKGSFVLEAHPLPDAALDADIAILGKKGRGKTFTAKGIVDRLLHLGRRVIVLDPLSVWWGLKASADGKSPRYPIAVFGGPKGDIPITGGSGQALGQLLSRTSISAVLDLGEMRKAEQARLVADLLDHLFTVNRDPLWLVLEEADAFAPHA